MRNATPRLHPMGLGELLDTTFALCRANFPLFAGIVALLIIPETIVSFGLQSRLTTASIFSVGTSGSPNINVARLAGLERTVVISSFVALIFNSLITGALAQAISARYLGRPITIGQAFASVGIATFAALALASILEGILLIVGFVFFVFPAIYLYIRFQFISQAIVLERHPILGAFSRSGELVSGSWWRVAGYVLVIYVLLAVLQSAFGGLAAGSFAFSGGQSGRIIATVMSAVIGILVKPFQLGALTLLYYDLRIRKEGFDLEHLARHLD